MSIINEHVIDGKKFTRVYFQDKPTNIWRCRDSRQDLMLRIHVVKLDKYGRVQTSIKGKNVKFKP